MARTGRARGLSRAGRARASAAGSRSTSASPPASARPTACSRRPTRCKQRGVDVVLGFIETHGRAETAALIEGLEYVPRRAVEYRGVVVEEMDLDAVLARQPQVALVDEVAHTNAPGSRNRKRYQDVLDILDAGINVICAFNVQHLESLKDLVERATGVRDPRDGARQLPQAGRPGRQPRPGRRGSARSPARGQDLRPGQGRRGRSSTSSRRATWPPCASWRCARWPRAWTARTPRPAPAQRRRAQPRPAARDGLHLVVLAARGHAAAARLAHGRPAQHRLVRRLRRDAGRGARPHRRRGAAPPARQHRAGARARRRGRAPAGRRSGGRRSSTSRARTASATS